MLAFQEDRDRATTVIEDWDAHVSERGPSEAERADLQRVRILLDAVTGRAEGTLQALREAAVAFGCPDCWPELRTYAAAREGRTAEAIHLSEAVRGASFLDTRLAGTFGVQAMLLLGPLNEEAGDTTRAVEAYERVAREWANADARGMERVREAEARIEALSEELGEAP